MTRLQRLAWTTLGATLVLVVVGGYTRGSGSGYGCADRWPLCEGGALGGLLPRADEHMIVEWSHRWVAAIVGVLALATAVTAWRQTRRDRAVVGPAFAALILVVVQAYVGRLVVVRQLDADLVTLHLANAMAVVALMCVTAVNVRYPAVGRPPLGAGDDRWPASVRAGAALSIVVLLLGSSVHNQYVAGWPLVGDELVPNLSTRVIALHFLHRVAAGLLALVVVALVVVARRRARPRAEQRLILAAAVATYLNVALGAAHVFTEVSSRAVVVLHLGAASLVWVFLLLAALLARRHDAAGAGSKPVEAVEVPAHR